MALGNEYVMELTILIVTKVPLIEDQIAEAIIGGIKMIESDSVIVVSPAQQIKTPG